MYWSIFENAPRSDPLLFINLWNMFNRTDQELSWTNNRIEGWHQNLQGHLSACRPNFWKFINVLKKEKAYVRVSILQHQGGHLVQSKILRIIDDYPDRQLLDYLRNIAQNIAFDFCKYILRSQGRRCKAGTGGNCLQ